MSGRRPETGRDDELPFDAAGEHDAGESCTRRVTIEPDDGSDRYVILDAARRRVFGGRVFRSALEAEVYLQEANRRSHWMRWHLAARRRGRRKTIRRTGGRQLNLF